MSFDSNVYTVNLSESIIAYLTEAERLLAGVPMPPDYEGESVGTSVTEFCNREVERALADQHDRTEVKLIVETLSIYGCDGSNLLARLIAARFAKKLSPNADILLDAIRQSDPDLVFRVNNFTHSSYIRHTLCVDPIRFASFDDYINLITERGYKRLQGQKFGL
jgi:hypothetical protein